MEFLEYTPEVVYTKLKARKHKKLSSYENERLQSYLDNFFCYRDGWNVCTCRESWILRYKSAFCMWEVFCKWFIRRSWLALNKYLGTLEECYSIDSCREPKELDVHVQLSRNEYLYSIFIQYYKDQSADSDEKRKIIFLHEATNLTQPQNWYPKARMIKRKVTYHCGPTNSGKTYNALQRLMQASSGIYCSPLRLLAMEVFKMMNAKEVPCILYTGQEHIDNSMARHLSCTIEIARLEQDWEVAVIDEIQMISNNERGGAWTRAFLGLQSKEIHLCGDATSIEVIQSLCESTGDDFVIKQYERMKPLEVCEPLCSLEHVQIGDCFIVFSKKDIFAVKSMIETNTNYKCCVIYGALPPQVRIEQATLFNDPNNTYNVLVATDAIGMGLNLNINRIIFWSLTKKGSERIDMSLLKQIAGRAGRWSSPFEKGFVTMAMHSTKDDMNYITECLRKELPPATHASLQPTLQHIQAFAARHDLGNFPNINLGLVLKEFLCYFKMNNCTYKIDNSITNMMEIAIFLQENIKNYSLSIRDAYTFCCVPLRHVCQSQRCKSMKILHRFAQAYNDGVPVELGIWLPNAIEHDTIHLSDLEDMYEKVLVYVWLAQQSPQQNLFPCTKNAIQMEIDISKLVNESLARWNHTSSYYAPPLQDEYYYIV